MAITNYSKFKHYKELIQLLPSSLPEEMMLTDQFLLERDEKKKLEIYYAPFEYINDEAKVVIVGITPGLHQMKKTYSTVLSASNHIENDEEILRQVKYNSSFEGTMRINLVKMLNELGLHEYLGLSTSMELFDQASHLMHATSLLPYPVFFNGKNYSGSTPNMLKTDMLKKYVTDYFAPEMERITNPLMIPLGVNVSMALKYLVDHKELDDKTILFGFPHPSGANGHRHRQFAENKNRMQEVLRRHFSY